MPSSIESRLSASYTNLVERGQAEAPADVPSHDHFQQAPFNAHEAYRPRRATPAEASNINLVELNKTPIIRNSMRIGSAIFLVGGLLQGACTFGACFTLIGQGAVLGLLIGLAIKGALLSQHLHIRAKEISPSLHREGRATTAEPFPR